jgi:FixJ family two-component response regulator
VLNGRTVVAIVDDQPSVLVGLKRLLNEFGFATEAFGSAEDFLSRAGASSLDCLVLDIHLGGMSGLELRRRLAAAGSQVPVIFITANDDDATRRAAADAGCAAFLGKPFSGLCLVDEIEKAVANPLARGRPVGSSD